MQTWTLFVLSSPSLAPCLSVISELVGCCTLNLILGQVILSVIMITHDQTCLQWNSSGVPRNPTLPPPKTVLFVFTYYDTIVVIMCKNGFPITEEIKALV